MKYANGGIVSGADFGNKGDTTAYSDHEGKEVVRPFSVGRINLDVLKVQPMMSDNISVHEIPILIPANIGVDDDFILHMLKGCPQWSEENIIKNIEGLTSALASSKEIDENTRNFLENEIKTLEKCLELLKLEREHDGN